MIKRKDVKVGQLVKYNMWESQKDKIYRITEVAPGEYFTCQEVGGDEILDGKCMCRRCLWNWELVKPIHIVRW